MQIFTATCPNCQTEFHADRSILAVAEVRLRCPKCFRYFEHTSSAEGSEGPGRAGRIHYFEANTGQ